MRRITYILTILLVSYQAMIADDAPFSMDESLLDSNDRTNLGLQYAPKSSTFTIYEASDTTDCYANGVVMAAYRGMLYCMWQSSARDEDSNDTWVAYSRSDNDGKTWSEPQRLSPIMAGCHCTSGGWVSSEGQLVAYLNVWRHDTIPQTCHTYYVETTDGTTWSHPQEVTWSDGTPIDGIMEQDPHRFSCGRLVGAVHLMPGMTLCPIYTDDPTGRTGWYKGYFAAKPNGKQSAELEPSFFIQKDSTLIMTMRDQRSSHRILASQSNDGGETWSKAVQTNIPDSRAKQCAGNLPNGTAFIVNNPITEKKPRVPLTIMLSKDGHLFSKAYLLRSGNNGDLPPQRYEGKYKTIGYSYPKAMICGNYLYIAYSTNKEVVQYTRIKISKL